MTELCGIINVYKEKGFTSHDVVNIVRKSLNKIKTGHTGTLDPNAEGVLPICVGKATKLAEYIASDIKRYIAVLTLGAFTTTQDLSGEIIESFPVTSSREEIIKVVKSFQGENMQIPPMYSAIKINGKKLYELARQGKEVERKERKINIYEINVLEFISENEIKIDVLCSKGTYIRTLCNDIGAKLGCGGYMSSLLRTRAGNFFLENAIKIDEIKKFAYENKINEFIISPENVMPNVKKVYANEIAEKFLKNGNKISYSFLDSQPIDGEKIFIYSSKGELNGLYEADGDFVRPVVMLK